MAFNYIDVKDESLKKGIDAHSSDGEIQEGYCADAVNVDLDGDYVSKRLGYEIIGGEIPIKVTKAVVSGTKTIITLTCDSNYDFDDITIPRLVIYGRMDSSICTADPLTLYSTSVTSANNVLTCTTLTGTSLVADGTDETPELYIYGIARSDATSSAAQLTVNHLDKYVTADTNTLICGIEGNLFKLADPSITIYTGIMGAWTETRTLGPSLWYTGESPGINIYLTSDSSSDNKLPVSSISYNSSTGYTEYTLTAVNVLYTGCSAVTGIFVPGYTIHFSGLMKDEYNGSFKIKSATSTSTTITVAVNNTNITNDDWNISETSGYAGIFCIKMSLGDNFVENDIIYGETTTIIPETLNISVVGQDGSSSILDGFISTLSVTSGDKIYATRTSNCIVPYSDSSASTVTDLSGISLFRNDSITISNQETSLDDGSLQEKIEKIYRLDSNSYVTVGQITGDGTTATLDATPGLNLQTGDYIYILTGVYKGIHLITSDNYAAGVSTTLTFSSTYTETYTSCNVAAHLIQLGRSVELNGYSSAGSPNEIIKPYQWYPILPVNYSYGIAESYEFPDTNFIHSVMANDTLYLTNGYDAPPRKFDGTNITKTGIFNYKPHLFVTLDETTTSKIAINVNKKEIDGTTPLTTVGMTSILLNAAGDETSFEVGQKITFRREDTLTTFLREEYTITDIDTTTHIISFFPGLSASLSAGTGTETYYVVSNHAFYKYYTRVALIDTNKNVIAGPSLGAGDLTILLTESAGIRIRGVVYPSILLEEYDSAGFVVEIFRTKRNDPSTYYKIVTLPLSQYYTYWDYVDFNTDINLTESAVDVVPTTIIGDIGATRAGPIPANLVTIINNKACYGNLQDFNRIDCRVDQKANTPIGGGFSGVEWEITNTAGTKPIKFKSRALTANGHAITAVASTQNTSFTITYAAGGAAIAEDWIYIGFGSDDTNQDPTFCGWWRVSNVSSGPPDTLTIPWLGSPANGSITTEMTTNLRFMAPSSTSDTNQIPIPYPISDMNINGSYSLFSADNRTAYIYTFVNAINSIMALVSSDNPITVPTVGTYESPFITAEGGSDYQLGQFILTQTNFKETAYKFKITASSAYFNVFFNGSRQEYAAYTSFIRRTYPNRLIVSYQNFPEIFDNIRALSASESLSVIDVDPSDGDEITAIIPFFGDSSFGSSQKTNALVVFKNYSIYLVDTEAKEANFRGTSYENYVKKIESRGLGCEAPFSPITTKYGILFANRSGVYILQPNMEIVQLSKMIERLWKDEELLDNDYISTVSSSNCKALRQYRVSLTSVDNTSNSDVLVYHDKEEEDGGGWTRYTDIPATLWANLGNNTYFGSTSGLVFTLLNNKLPTDYRDNDSAIESYLVTKATDFGVPDSKKAVKSITHYYNNTYDLDQADMKLQYAIDLDEEFSDTTEYKVRGSREDSPTSFGDVVRKKETGVVSAIKNRRATYFQFKFLHDTINQGFKLIKIIYKVAGLKTRGPKEAKSTQDET